MLVRIENVDHGYEYPGSYAVAGGAPQLGTRPDMFARCVRCGDLAPLGWTGHGGCRCGAIREAYGASRLGFGSCA